MTPLQGNRQKAKGKRKGRASLLSSFCLLPFAFCLLTPLLVAAPGFAQSGKATETLPYVQRTDAFRRLLFELHFQPIKDFARLHANPRESILIVLGDTSCLANGYFPEGLLPFVQQGGAVLVATDMEVRNPEASGNLIKLAGVTVTGQTFQCLSPDHCYGQFPFCPIVEPIADTNPLSRPTNVLGALASVIGGGGRPALFRNPRPDQPDLQVATNAPSRLEVRGWFGLPGGVHRLAQLPQGCVDQAAMVRPRGGWRQPPPEPPLFAVGGAVGDGRVLVLADHSVFINRMILPRDTGNLEFAANCLHWLRGGVSTPGEAMQAMGSTIRLEQLAGQRDKVLFWDDGRTRTDFEVPLKKMPLRPSLGSEPAIVAAIDQTLARLEDNHAFDEGLFEFFDDQGWSTRKLQRFGLYLLTLAALVLAAYRLVRYARHRLDAAVPMLAQAVTQHEPKASLLEQRRRALLRSGNVWETVHQLARQQFEAAGIPLTDSSPPRLAIEGGWWQRWRFRRRVARLWELARGETPARISPPALRRWLRDLEELKTAMARGMIQRT
jgi:hypothetical protein